MNKLLYLTLLATFAATMLDLAWQHDGLRLAVCGVAFGIVWMLRDELVKT